MQEKTLDDLAPALLQHLEGGDNRDRNALVNEFFSMLAKEDELSSGWVNPGYYLKLAEIVKRDLLPLYENFVKRKNEIYGKRNHFLLGCIGGTILVGEFLEAFIFKSRSAVPWIALPSLCLEALIGLKLYEKIYGDRHAAARKQFLDSVKGLDRVHQIDHIHESILEERGVGGDVTELLLQYDNSQEFWDDFKKVLDKDPKDEESLKGLGLPKFEKFLRFNVKDDCTDTQRKMRYDKLLAAAEERYHRPGQTKYITEKLAHMEERKVQRPKIAQ